MNIPAIRKALTALRVETKLHKAVVRVGLRACDEFGKRKANTDEALAAWNRVVIISDILREAGVEVER